MGAPGGGLMDIVGTPFKAIGLDPTGLPVIGGMFGSSDAEKAQTAQMRQAAQAYQAMRGPQAAARSASLGNTLEGIGGGGNALMERVYGPGMGMDFEQAAQNPITPEMLAIGDNQVAAPGGGGGVPGAGLGFALGGPGGAVTGGALGALSDVF